MQTETLSAVFETYFRILKHSIQPTVARCVPILLLERVEHNMNFLTHYVLSIRGQLVDVHKLEQVGADPLSIWLRYCVIMKKKKKDLAQIQCNADQSCLRLVFRSRLLNPIDGNSTLPYASMSRQLTTCPIVLVIICYMFISQKQLICTGFRVHIFYM